MVHEPLHVLLSMGISLSLRCSVPNINTDLNVHCAYVSNTLHHDMNHLCIRIAYALFANLSVCAMF